MKKGKFIYLSVSFHIKENQSKQDGVTKDRKNITFYKEIHKLCSSPNTVMIRLLNLQELDG